MAMSPMCKKCGCELSMDNIQALPDGQGFVCKNCPNKEDSGRIPKFLNDYKQFSDGKGLAGAVMDVEPIDTSRGFFTDKTYFCDHCRKTFKKKADQVVKVCFHCGSSEISQQFDTFAEQLLKE